MDAAGPRGVLAAYFCLPQPLFSHQRLDLRPPRGEELLPLEQRYGDGGKHVESVFVVDASELPVEGDSTDFLDEGKDIALVQSAMPGR
jgi:hypothetical protein